MFTIEQIQKAHSQVKSGADFPAYIQELKKMGVKSYETYVTDGRTEYLGRNEEKDTWPAKYAAITIADNADKIHFEKDLKTHQQGKSDYPTVVKQAAASGIWKWAVDLDKMTCTYYDKSGNQLIVEQIPE